LAEMLRDLPARTSQLHAVARQVYRHWVNGLPRPAQVHLHGGW